MTETTAFKDYFDAAMAQQLAADIQQVYPAFDANGFVTQVTAQLPPLALKARVAVFAAALREHLPPAYPAATAILLQILGDELTVEQGMFNDGWFIMPLAYFVEVYGLDDFDVSMHAIQEITKRHSSEFAIRPFLEKYPDRVLAILHDWTAHPSPHVRRLVSEGTRPRLPWAGRLNQFIADPAPTLALLEKLKDDDSAYVRKSVANHLNDIAKDHPARVIAVCRRWLQDADANRQWIVRHALRTLIKAGEPDALAVLGYGPPQVTLQAFTVTPTVTLGKSVTFSCTLRSESSAPQELLIDTVMHFLKANGKTSPKVFKLGLRTLAPGETVTIERSQPIRPVTTRRYYAGAQRVEIQVNGEILGGADFELRIP